MASWIDEEEATAAGHFAAVTPTHAESIFAFTQCERTGSYSVVAAAKIGGKVPTQSVLLRMPVYLRDRLKASSAGSEQAAILGLLEFALSELDKRNLTLQVDNKVL